MARVDYDRMAAVYDAGRDLTLSALEAWRDAVRAHVGSTAGLRLLDLGAGTGRFSSALCEWLDAEVVAVEPSGAMVGQAVRKPTKAAVTYLRGRAESIPLRAACCDAAWLSTVIHHVSDLALAAHELRRVLRPRAPVLIRNWFPGHTSDPLVFRFFPGARRLAETFPTIEDIVAAFTSAGFKTEALDPVEQVSAPSLRVFRDRVRIRADSTLEPLSDEEFARGMASLDAVVAEETTATPVIGRLDLLVLR